MSNQPAETKKDKFFVFTVPIIIVLVILIGVFTWILYFAPETNFLTQLPGIKQTRQFMPQYPEVTAVPSPSPIPTRAPKPIGTGKKGFTISGGNQNAPKFNKSFLDPIDPEQGASQTIIINAENSSPIETVEVTVKTDNKQTPVEMKLTDGSQTSGTWEGSWTVDDTYLKNYRVEVIATGDNGKQEVELTLR